MSALSGIPCGTGIPRLVINLTPDNTMEKISMREPTIRASAETLASVMRKAQDARMVFLGEASHGVSEFTLFKTDLLRLALAGNRPIIVVLEAGHLETSVIADRFDRGDVEGAVRDILYPVFQTREWLGLFSLLANAASTVPVYGMDCRCRGVAETPLTLHLREIDISLAERFDDAERQLKAFNVRGPVQAGEERNAFVSVRDSLACVYTDCLAAVTPGVLAGGIRADRICKQRLGLLETLDDTGKYFAFREQSMADNLLWIHDTEDPEAQIFVLTHNEHLRKNIDAGDEGHSIRTLLGGTAIDAHSVGLYGRSGTVMLNNGRTVGIAPPPDDFLEAQTFACSAEDVVSIATPDRKFSERRRKVREFCVSGISIVPEERYDDIVLFRRMHGPEIL